eukprot:5468004-Pyramimonas_sp.AAC.1
MCPTQRNGFLVATICSGGPDVSTVAFPVLRLPMGRRKTLCIDGWIYVVEIRQSLTEAHIQG